MDPQIGKPPVPKDPDGHRIRILTFVAHYLPGYKAGGPLRSISNLVRALNSEVEFLIVTRDRDAATEVAYDEIVANSWNRVGHAQVFYSAPDRLSLGAIRHLLKRTSYDVVYFNSYFDRVFTIKPLLLRRVGKAPNVPGIIAPRGEFSAGALKLSRWRKLLYIWLAKLTGLYDGLLWQASSVHEAGDIQRVMHIPASSIVIAPNIASAGTADDASDVQLPRRNEHEPLRLIFLSRITPKKNLDFALRILARVAFPLELTIAGPVRDKSYWSKCQALIRDLPTHISVSVLGGVEHSQVKCLMAEHDLFFFPTRGENYGHVIPEALGAGTPVLIADTTPWRELQEAGVGWDLPLEDEKAFVDAIEQAANVKPDEYVAWRKRVTEYARVGLSDSDVLEANRTLFKRAVTGKSLD